MTKQEQQNIVKMLYKTVQPMKISRKEKEQIYYALISGLAMCDGFNEDYLLGYDIVFNEQLRNYKQCSKDKF